MVRTAARLANGTRISDHVTLGVLTTTIPADLVDAVLAETGRQSQRQRQLPARVVVYYPGKFMRLDASAGRAVVALASVVLPRVIDAAPGGRRSGADCEAWGCGSTGSAGASAPVLS